MVDDDDDSDTPASAEGDVAPAGHQSISPAHSEESPSATPETPPTGPDPLIVAGPQEAELPEVETSPASELPADSTETHSPVPSPVL